MSRLNNLGSGGFLQRTFCAAVSSARCASIRTKISALLIGPIALLIYFIYAVWQPQVSEYVGNYVERNARSHIATLGDALAPYLIQNQIAAVYETVRVIENREQLWQSVELVDAEGVRLYPLSDVGVRAGQFNQRSLSHDIAFRDERIATLHVSINLAAAQKAIDAQIRTVSIMACAIFLVAIIAIAGMLEFAILRRLQTLASVSDKLADGDYDSVLPRSCGDEVGTLTESFRSMRDSIRSSQQRLLIASREAIEANTAKSDFLATMSHEIRTPMNGVLGTAKLLEETSLTAEQQKLVGILSDSGQSLLSIINDILDFSRLEAGYLQLKNEKFELGKVLESVTALMSDTATASQNILQLSVSDQLHRTYYGDSGRLRQVLLNLTSNALKFTENGQVHIQVEPADSGRIRFSITDSGIGIPSEQHAQLFDRFTQVDSSYSRRHEGAGLGLAICKHIVEIMGGTIDVRSEVGCGSTFWFEVPFEVVSTVSAIDDEPATKREADQQARALATEETTTSDAVVEGAAVVRPSLAIPDTRMEEPLRRPMRILVAEDNCVNQMLVQMMLSPEGHEIELVENGVEAVEAVQQSRFDLVLMDVQMPGMSGLDATRAIRALDGADSTLPIIALTANARAEDELRCREAGMDGFVSKPIDKNLLLKALQGVQDSLQHIAAGGVQPRALQSA